MQDGRGEEGREEAGSGERGEGRGKEKGEGRRRRESGERQRGARDELASLPVSRTREASWCKKAPLICPSLRRVQRKGGTSIGSSVGKTPLLSDVNPCEDASLKTHSDSSPPPHPHLRASTPSPLPPCEWLSTRHHPPPLPSTPHLHTSTPSLLSCRKWLVTHQHPLLYPPLLMPAPSR